MTSDKREFLFELDVEVGEELILESSSEPEPGNSESPADWLVDPTDYEREEVGLRNIQGAVEALEEDAPE